MFEKIKELVKRVMELFSKNDVKAAIGAESTVSDAMSQAIATWKELYMGNAPWIGETVKGLGLPAAIAAEIARLATIELRATAFGSERAEFIAAQLDAVLPQLRRFMEYGIAMGGLAIKPYVKGDKLFVDFVQADAFVPTAVDGCGRICGGVFIDQVSLDGKIFTRLETHTLTHEGYVITNSAFVSDSSQSIGRNIALTAVEAWGNLEPRAVIKNVDIPLFAYFKFPAANTVDTASPLGVSAFARAVGLIEQADRQYSRLLWEFESGERAVYVSDTAFLRDERGNVSLPNKRLYRTLETGDDLFEDFSPTLREGNIIAALDSILCKVEDVCGLARGTFSSDSAQARTATELKILRQRSYATIVDTQKAVECALRDLCAAMDVWCSVYGLAPYGEVELAFEFDDSVIVDRKEEFDERCKLVDSGVMQSWEMRCWYLGESEDVAKGRIQV